MNHSFVLVMRYVHIFIPICGALFWGCGTVATPAHNDDPCHDLVVRQCSSTETPAEIVTACHDLFAQRIAFAQRCTGPNAQPSANEEQNYVNSCIGIATSVGVTLTAQDIEDCADQMTKSPCLGGGVFPACTGYESDLLFPDHTKKGTLAPGNACIAQVQCDSGYCEHGVDTCGMCKYARNLGDSCNGDTDVCTEGECVDGICQLSGKTIGAECTTHGIDCQSPLYCKPDVPMQTTPICVAKGAIGSSCDNENPCLDKLVCLGNVCTKLAENGEVCTGNESCLSGYCSGGTCTAVPTGLVEGQDCSIGFCRADLLCDANQKCVSPTYLPAGSACTSSSFPSVMCESGLYCRPDCMVGNGCPDAGTCQKLPSAGEHCTQLAQCAPGSICEGFDPTDLTKSNCVQLGKTGEMCPCQDELVCISGMCVAYGACQ